MSITTPRPQPLPQAPAKYDQDNEKNLRTALTQADGKNYKKGQDLEIVRPQRLILRSANGTRYALVVDNSGNLSTSAA